MDNSVDKMGEYHASSREHWIFDRSVIICTILLFFVIQMVILFL